MKKLDNKGWTLDKAMPYLFVLPAFIVLLVLKYYPMVGIQIAFRDYIAPLGFWKSPWVGLKHFRRFFSSPMCKTVIVNTLKVTIIGTLVSFPLPIIAALSLNEIQNMKVKKFYQTCTWAPHFVSTVVVASMIFLFTSPSSGVINKIIGAFGHGPINFMVEPGWFLPIYIISGIWQGLGWGMIIYLASLAGVSPELHEAATVDGASKFQRIIHINLPHLLPIIVVQLILESGKLLSVGFEKVFLLQTPLNQSAAEVLSTYTYRSAFIDGQMSYSTAVGLFSSVINLILMCTVNSISKKVNDSGLW